MCSARIISMTTLLLALGQSSRADTPYETYVAIPEVEVRSGPSPTLYATSKLHQGDKVNVVKEVDGGWLAIKPPPGSFSWIDSLFVDHTGQAGIVLDDSPPLRVGSELSNQPPSVGKVTARRGTQIFILDLKKVYEEDGHSWFPITPLPEEVRYLPADAVKNTPAVQTATAAPGAPGNQTPGNENPLWTQALQAEAAGKCVEAERIYLQLAKTTQDHDLSLRCYNRVHYMHEACRGPGPSPYQPGRPTETYYPTGSAPARLIPAPAGPGWSNSNPPAATSQYTYVRDTPQRVVQAQPVGYAPPPPPPPQWSGPGYLRRASYFLDNKATYVLESAQGFPRLYITAQPGLNLEPYVGTNVNIYGPIVYRGEIKTNYMSAAQVAPLR